MVVGVVGLAGMAGGLGGVAVCPERKEANKRNAAARRIKGDSPRGKVEFQNTGWRWRIESGFAMRFVENTQLRISMDNGGAVISDHHAAECIR
jgi:hypothetical protein